LSGQRTFSATGGGVIIETLAMGAAIMEDSASCYARLRKALRSALIYFKEYNELNYGGTRR